MTSICIVITAAVSFSVTAVVGKLLIPLLRRLKCGQSIREDGPSWHKSKQGTPTMGGVMFGIGTLCAVAFGYVALISVDAQALDWQATARMFAGAGMALLFGLIGFWDDYIKVVKKRNLGLTAGQKMLMQILITALYLAVLYLIGVRSTSVQVPFLGTWDLGYFYYPIMGILIVGIVNSVNLTDGIDGLCSSVTFVVAIFFMLSATVLGRMEVSILSTALAGGCLGFLLYNVHPAKVFMGDTGSLFLGGMVVALGFSLEMEFILFFTGFIYCLEALSDILQVISYKTRHKRIFRMAPIHHHFEMGGMSENRILLLFCAITLVMSAIGFLAVLQIR